jgi:hydrogenase maturation factor
MTERVFQQLTDACVQLNIDLVGGHCEVTPSVDRPLIIGTMLGEATRDGVVLGNDVTPGDTVLMTKRSAIEGTALLARECADALRARGVADEVIERAAGMLVDPGISVVPDARAVCGAAKPRLMHDPTEGGIATALHELAEAAGATLRVSRPAVSFLDETRAFCDALDLDPWGLLASGSLLAVVAPHAYRGVASALADVKIECSAIGTVESGEPRVIMDGEAAPLPRFDRDELARFFDRSGG